MVNAFLEISRIDSLVWWQSCCVWIYHKTLQPLDVMLDKSIESIATVMLLSWMYIYSTVNDDEHHLLEQTHNISLYFFPLEIHVLT